MEQNIFNRRVINLSVVMILLSFLMLVISWNKIPPLVPLYYSLPWGDNQLTEPVYLFILPISSSLILGMNIVITRFSQSDGFLRSVAVSSAMFFSFLSLFTLFRIVLLVI